MRFSGGKGVCFAQIINLIPPHKRYIETHLGGGAVMRNKRPALEQIGIDIDPAVINKWKSDKARCCTLINEDALLVLKRIKLDHETVIYVDPPYLPTTRRRSRVYKFDYTVDEHVGMLEFLSSLECKVIISGYYSEIYTDLLRGWNIYSYKAQSHSGIRDEYLWYNFVKPETLHDTRYVGNNFREREVIRRRGERLKNRILQLSITEQTMIHEWLGKQLGGKVLL